MLIKSAVITPKDATFDMDTEGFDRRAYIIPLYETKEDNSKEPILSPVLLFLNEKLRVSPMSFTGYNILMDKPYKRPTKW